MTEPVSDKHYEEKFEFPLWKLIKQRAEEKDISYVAVAGEVMLECTCWIGAFDSIAAREVLSLPDEVEPIAFTPIGYPNDQLEAKKRKPIAELVSYDHW